MTALLYAQPADHRRGPRAESLLCLVFVVCVHVAVLAALSQSRAPSETRPPVVVELIAPQLGTVPNESIMRERVPPQPAPRASESRHVKPPARTGQPRVAEQDVAPATVPDKPSLPVAPRELVESPASEASEPARNDSTPAALSSGSAAPNAAAAPTTPSAVRAPDIEPPRFDAPSLRNPRAEYPRLSRRMGEQGRVILRVYVSSAGLPRRIEVQSSSGAPRLDLAAREAVAQWKFVPARRGDEAVGAWLLVPIVFRLED